MHNGEDPKNTSAAVSSAIRSRRSIRHFARTPVPTADIEDLVALACCAPAPHHSRPWRFVLVEAQEWRERLVKGLEEAWRSDYQADGGRVESLEADVARSSQELLAAPVLLLACLRLHNAAQWHDERRQRAEWDMYMQSLGAALQNILLAAQARGLAGYLKGAPLFCPSAVTAGLDLPQDWEPAFFVLLGYPDANFAPAPRPDRRLDEFLLRR